MAHILCDIIIDFLTTDPENDTRVARSVMDDFEQRFQLPSGSFEMGDVKAVSMGWSAARLFLSLELAQKLYENNSYEIEEADERIKTYQFLAWLNGVFSKKGCKAQLKYADEMKNTGGGYKYSSHLVTVFSDEFSWSR